MRSRPTPAEVARAAAPGRWPTDGVIVHTDALDYKWKPVHTVDLLLNGAVWECRFADSGEPVRVKPRYDKQRGNHPRTVEEVRQAHDDNVTLDELSAALGGGGAS